MQGGTRLNLQPTREGVHPSNKGARLKKNLRIPYWELSSTDLFRGPDFQLNLEESVKGDASPKPEYQLRDVGVQFPPVGSKKGDWEKEPTKRRPFSS